MARYEHLPIYAKAYELALFVEQQVHGFSRFHKYAVGADLRELCRTLLRQIIRANNASAGRAAELDALRVTVEEFLVMLRLAKDTRAVASLKAYEQAGNLAISVGRQAEGWLRKSQT
jgi:hypothetical protein